MPTAKCQCGARYKVPESAAGRRARCKKCGQVFTVPAKAPEPATIELADLAAGESLERPAPSAAPKAAAVATVGYAAADVAQARGVYGAYFTAIGRSFLFPGKVSNLTSLLVIWFLLVINTYIASFWCIGLLVSFIITGWYMAFQFNTVLHAADGQEGLPELSVSEGWYEGILVPIGKYMATWIATLAPVIIYVTLLMIPSGFSLSKWNAVMAPAMSGNYGAMFALQVGQVLFLVLLLFGGLALRPMLLLVVAVGGVGGLFRLDLMARTIFATFPAYACSVAVVLAAAMLPAFVAGAGPDMIGARFTGEGAAFTGIVCAVNVYCTLVAMRVIGLHYHHFKHRFAWSWG